MTEQLRSLLEVSEEFSKESKKIRIAAAQGTLMAREIEQDIKKGNLTLVVDNIK